MIKNKFQDEIISRLSELSHKSFGKLNFYFATKKLDALENEFDDFKKFIENNNFKARRDEFISHKKLPATWSEHRAEHRISYNTILKGIAKALILMKELDRIYLGEDSIRQWIRVRKSRYEFAISAKVAHMTLSYNNRI